MEKVHFVHAESEKYRKISSRDHGKIFLSTSLVLLLHRSLQFHIWNRRKLFSEGSLGVPGFWRNNCRILNLVLFVKCVAKKVIRSAVGVRRCVTVVGSVKLRIGRSISPFVGNQGLYLEIEWKVSEFVLLAGIHPWFLSLFLII
jgi:hypothetical protein